MPVLVDNNVLLDVLTEDPRWYQWSADSLARQAERDVLAVNPIIYAEVSVGFIRIEELDAALPTAMIHRLALPWDAAFLAGKCFVSYRKRGGARRSPLPDFRSALPRRRDPRGIRSAPLHAARSRKVAELIHHRRPALGSQR